MEKNWSHHILKTTKRASKLIGLIYQRYYMSSSQGTLYLSFVRPIVDYAALVWDPHYACHIQALEKVQRFALRMSAKLWDHDYLFFGLPSRRKILNYATLLELSRVISTVHTLLSKSGKWTAG